MNKTSSSSPTTHLIGDLVEALCQEAADTFEARRSGLPLGPVTGLQQVDEALGGFLAPGVHILQAAPGAGKTAFCLQTAVDCGFPALFISPEMRPQELLWRLIARTTRTSLSVLRSGDLDTERIRQLALMAVAKARNLAVMDATRGFASPSDHILPAAERLRDRANTGSVIIIIDGLQSWVRGVGGTTTEYDRVSAGIASIHEVAARLGSPVLCVSHRNRTGQKAGGLHASKGSGDLEYLGETVLELTPTEDASLRHDSRAVRLGILKNRYGGAGIDVSLAFSGAYQCFREA